MSSILNLDPHKNCVPYNKNKIILWIFIRGWKKIHDSILIRLSILIKTCGYIISELL